MILGKIKRELIMIVCLVSAIFLVMIGCGSDDGVSSEFANVNGTITFKSAAAWPDSGDMLVTLWATGIWTTMGPIGPPAGTDTLVKVSGQSQYSYEFEAVSPGEYSAVAVGWRHPDESLPASQRTVTLGVYWGDEDSTSVGISFSPPFAGPAPQTFSVEKGDNLTLNFQADNSLINAWLSLFGIGI